jgi:hypothetical protein
MVYGFRLNVYSKGYRVLGLWFTVYGFGSRFRVKGVELKV